MPELVPEIDPVLFKVVIVPLPPVLPSATPVVPEISPELLKVVIVEPLLICTAELVPPMVPLLSNVVIVALSN